MSTGLVLQGDQILTEFKRALKELHVNADTQVTLDVRDNSVVITPVRENDETRAADFKEAMEKSNQRYAETFRALAK